MNAKDTIREYDKLAENYDKDYYKKNPKVNANWVRVELVGNRFKALKCKKVVDAGCGSGEPMIRFMKKGIKDVRGFDISPKMVQVSKDKMMDYNLNPRIIELADLERKIPFKNVKFDGMMMHGALMHCENETRLLNNANKMLKKNGVILCEARNELMSLFSLNGFSQEFFLKLVDYENLPKPIKQDVLKYYSRFKGNNKNRWDAKMQTRFYNPFTIHKLFEKSGFKIDKLHFAHYHSLPPIFEKKYPEFYKESSLKIENPDDWRGYFMASTFLVEAHKV